MTDLDLLHFEQLKKEVQDQYLKSHTPSQEDISRWKGIDIIYFQEDLRKIAKGNISEKSFYTYFKTSPVVRLPRIDMLNLLSVYSGYTSWYDFKKNHLFADEILKKMEEEDVIEDDNNYEIEEEDLKEEATVIQKPEAEEKPVLQNNYPEHQNVVNKILDTASSRKAQNYKKESILLLVSVVLFAAVLLLIFKDTIFSREYTYRFIDADRNSQIRDNLDVKIIKENESPILFTVAPNEDFTYTTKSKTLQMVVSSPFYKTDTINRNLENAPTNESIELKPNDYAIMLYYYSRSLKDLKKKRETLNQLISDNALIYQVYDNQYYGVETLDKQKYITLVTLPSTSLENLDVIETQMKNDKIVMIKFRIGSNEIPAEK